MQTQPVYDIEERGTLVFENSELPLTPMEWQQLESLVAQSPFEHIIGGDAGESHSVHVSRYYNDVEEPVALNAIAPAIADIVMSPKMRRFYARFTGTETLCLRRCQANKMLAGDFIGMHKDQDSSPDYYATVVFHLDSAYTGGHFETCDQRRYRPARHMALVNNCSISHQVTPVESGTRLTLACFLSPSFAPSRRPRKNFRVEK
ncbi:MAG TPA: 2OG-Fe(II) oxygenase [Thiotrichales bacterium]|nr:2OG-Fe(II) oxygenase [Thiotrichales bacterium]